MADSWYFETHVLQENFSSTCKFIFIFCNKRLWRQNFAIFVFFSGESLMILQIKAKNQVLQKKKAGKIRLFLFIILPLFIGRGLSLIRHLRWHLPLWEGFFICRGRFIRPLFIGQGLSLIRHLRWHLPLREGFFICRGGYYPPVFLPHHRRDFLSRREQAPALH